LDHVAVTLTDRRQAPALAIERARDEIQSAHSQIGKNCAQLRQIADRRISAMGGLAEDCEGAGLRPEQPKNRAHKCGLTGAVGNQHSNEFADFDLKAHIGEHLAVTDAQRNAVKRNDAHELGPLSALSSASSSLSTQSWNDTFGGIVSVTPTTGTLAFPAIS